MYYKIQSTSDWVSYKPTFIILKLTALHKVMERHLWGVIYHIFNSNLTSNPSKSIQVKNFENQSKCDAVVINTWWHSFY